MSTKPKPRSSSIYARSRDVLDALRTHSREQAELPPVRLGCICRGRIGTEFFISPSCTIHGLHTRYSEAVAMPAPLPRYC